MKMSRTCWQKLFFISVRKGEVWGIMPSTSYLQEPLVETAFLSLALDALTNEEHTFSAKVIPFHYKHVPFSLTKENKEELEKKCLLM